LIAFDGELLFHNNCRPIYELRTWTNATNNQIVQDLLKDFYLFEKAFAPFQDPHTLELLAHWRQLLEKNNLVGVVLALDETWKDVEYACFALLLDNDLDKLVEILTTCAGDKGWERLAWASCPSETP
jgi:hypothetical protein